MKDILAIINNLDNKILESLAARYTLMSILQTLSIALPENKDKYYKLVKALIEKLANKGDYPITDSFVRAVIEDLSTHFTFVSMAFCHVPHPDAGDIKCSTLCMIELLKTKPPKEDIPSFVIPYLKELIEFRFHVNPKLKEEVEDLVALERVLDKIVPRLEMKDCRIKNIKALLNQEEALFKETPEAITKLAGFSELRDKIKSTKELLNKQGDTEEEIITDLGEFLLSFITKHKEFSQGIPESIIKKIKKGCS